jgi:hypothetical protein
MPTLDLLSLSGSINLQGSLTGSLQGTSSYAVTSLALAEGATVSLATTASYAVSASWAPTPTPTYREYVATIEYSGVSGFYITQMANTIGDGSNTAGNDITWSVVGNGVLWAEMNDAFIGNVQINPCIFLAGANIPHFMVGEVFSTGILQFNITKYDGIVSSTPSFYTTVSIKVYN